MEQGTARWLEAMAGKIYGFCLNRLHRADDAEDLAQDILLAAAQGLERQDVRNPEAWIWRVAHNRYARYCGHRPRAVLSLDDVRERESLDFRGVPGQELERREELRAAFAAVHGIASAQRSLLIDFTIHGLSYEQLAEKYGLSVTAVGLRLRAGRRKLRERWQETMEERKIYEKLIWEVLGNGAFDPKSYLNRQVCRAIVRAAYEKPATVEEIAEATGLPCLYIEDEIPALLEGEALAEGLGRGGEATYAASLIIHTPAFRRQRDALMEKAARRIAPLLAERMAQEESFLRGIGFQGSDAPSGRLWWPLVCKILFEAAELAARKRPETRREGFLPRKDGGCGWFVVEEYEDGRYPILCGRNTYSRDEDETGSYIDYYWSSRWYSHELGYFLRRLEREGVRIDPSRLDELTIAEGIRLGVIAQTGGGFAWTIPAATEDQGNMVGELCDRIREEVARLLEPAAEELLRLYRAQIPARLTEQIPGVFGCQLQAVGDWVCEELVKTGALAAPWSEPFTGQLWLCGE